MGLAYTLESLGEAYFLHAFRTGSQLPGAELVAWYEGWGWMSALGTLVTFVLLLFPDGRLPSRPWMPVAVVSGAAVFTLVAIGAAAAWLVRKDVLAHGYPTHPSSTARLLNSLNTDGQVVVGVCMLACASAVVVRYRHATPRGAPAAEVVDLRVARARHVHRRAVPAGDP